MENPATRDLLLRPGTLTETLMCPAPAVKQHLVSIDKWAKMLSREPPDEPVAARHQAQDGESAPAWANRLRVEITHW